jgi:hypothetical protein
MTHEKYFRKIVYDKAARYGHLHILEWLADKYSYRKNLFTHIIDTFTAEEACDGGHVSILEWLKNKNIYPRRRYKYMVLFANTIHIHKMAI